MNKQCNLKNNHHFFPWECGADYSHSDFIFKFEKQVVRNSEGLFGYPKLGFQKLHWVIRCATTLLCKIIKIWQKMKKTLVQFAFDLFLGMLSGTRIRHYLVRKAYFKPKDNFGVVLYRGGPSGYLILNSKKILLYNNFIQHDFDRACPTMRV